MSTHLVAHEAEQKVLHLCVSIPALAPKALSRLKDEHFDRPDFRVMWQALRQLVVGGKEVSAYALYKALQNAGAGNQTVLEILKDPLPGFMARDLEPAMAELELAETRQRIFRAADAVRNLATSPNAVDAVSLEVNAQAEIWNAMRGAAAAGTVTIGDAAEYVLHEWEQAADGKRPKRTATGYQKTLDRVLGGGFAPGDLIVLAGRPHMGKTAFALCTALAVAKNPEHHVLYFSPEMDEYALAGRAFQTFGITTDQATAPDAESVQKARKVLKHLKAMRLHIDPRRSLSVDDVVARSMAFTMAHPDTALIVVDHLQQLNVAHGEKNYVKAIGDICKRLRDMAGELDVPVLLLSQLNRGLESRDDKRPRMSDVRDSGHIEEHADVMFLLYREIVYSDAFPRELHNVCEVIVGKNRRTGRLNTMYLEFNPDFIRFQDGDVGVLSQYRQHMQTLAERKDEERRSKVRPFGRRNAG